MAEAWYNEFDPFASYWLYNLAEAGLIPPGRVDARNILEVEPDDLRSFRQCHFFAGIGGWSYALALAGWPADRECWTASLPCQPYSSAGQRRGAADERDLWPAFFRLVEQCRPAVIFGEQVASADVIGCIAGADENMQDVLDREAVFGVLRELERGAAEGLQGLRPGSGTETQESQSRPDARPSQEMAAGLSRSRLGECGEASRQIEGNTVRLESAGHSEADRGGSLRVNGHSIQSRRTESMECAVAGPDQAGSRIYQGKRKGSSACFEHDGERVGRATHHRDCQCDHCAARREVERLIARDRRSAQGADRLEWLTRIRDDLDRSGYTFGACVAPACSVKAPHIRQRLFWLADAGRDGRRQFDGNIRQGQQQLHAKGSGAAGGLGIAPVERREELDLLLQPGRPREAGADALGAGADRIGRDRQDVLDRHDSGRAQAHSEPRARREIRGLGDTDATRSQGWSGYAGECSDQRVAWAAGESFWSDAVWLPCLDGKARRIEPSIQPLAHTGEWGSGSRVGILRGAGNAIVPALAAEFIGAAMEAMG